MFFPLFGSFQHSQVCLSLPRIPFKVSNTSTVLYNRNNENTPKYGREGPQNRLYCVGTMVCRMAVLIFHITVVTYGVKRLTTAKLGIKREDRRKLAVVSIGLIGDLPFSIFLTSLSYSAGWLLTMAHRTAPNH